jgi:hypothetical protein
MKNVRNLHASQSFIITVENHTYAQNEISTCAGSDKMGEPNLLMR